ncbi:carboxymuconolactone decarboxylase family protein [Endothiovibrio diazotrophicus]
MTWITPVSPEQADGVVAEVYAAARAAWGVVPNAFLALSPSPATLETQWHFIQFCMDHPTFGAEMQTWLRMLISQQVSCRYCVDANAGMLAELHGRSAEEIGRGREDPQSIPLPERERALIRFALDHFRGERAADPAVVAGLRAAGWSEQEMLEILVMATRQAQVDALFNTLAVEPEAH